MSRVLLFLLFAVFAVQVQAKTPKEVLKAKRSVVSVITYRNGLLHGSGAAVLVGGNGEILASSTIFQGADSAVAIGVDGKALPVMRIAGVNGTFECLKARVKTSGRLAPMTFSSAGTAVGEERYLLSYGLKNSGVVEPVTVPAVDSIYSCVYYTVCKPAMEQTVALPLVNARGELVAVMQPCIINDFTALSGFLTKSFLHISSSIRTFFVNTKCSCIQHNTFTTTVCITKLRFITMINCDSLSFILKSSRTHIEIGNVDNRHKNVPPIKNFFQIKIVVENTFEFDIVLYARKCFFINRCNVMQLVLIFFE